MSTKIWISRPQSQPEVQRRLVPVDGEVGRGRVDEEVVPGAGEGAAAAEAVPLALRAPGAVAEHQLQGERVLVPEAVITAMMGERYITFTLFRLSQNVGVLGKTTLHLLTSPAAVLGIFMSQGQGGLESGFAFNLQNL